MAPKYIQVLTPENCKCYLIWQKRFADVIYVKDVCGDFAGLSGWALNVITTVLIKGRQRKSRLLKEEGTATMPHCCL